MMHDTFRCEIDNPGWGRHALLFCLGDMPASAEADIEQLVGPKGERWQRRQLGIRVNGNPNSLKVEAILIESDEDAVALRLALADFIIRYLSLTC